MPSGVTAALMKTRILLLADIHGNFPALRAIAEAFDPGSFHWIVNCGDSLVYAPFANETIDWLAAHQVISILGNTDKKVIDLLRGKSFKKPRKSEKRIMYTTAAQALGEAEKKWLLALGESVELFIPSPEAPERIKLGVFHGSPADPEELLFAETPGERFQELAGETDFRIVVTGHSHSPYHKHLSGVHFINPGSVGRMFDGDPRASCATLEITAEQVTVSHHRIGYPIDEVVAALRREHLPEIYATMFQLGRKLN